GVLVRRYAEHAKLTKRKWRYALKQLGLDFSMDGGELTETKGGLARRWGDRPVQKIDSSEIYTVVNDARRIGTPGIVPRKRNPSEDRARDLHTALSSMFGWLHRNRLVTANPCAGVWRPTSGQPRDRVLTPGEIVKFWRGCDKIHSTFGAVFQ